MEQQKKELFKLALIQQINSVYSPYHDLMFKNQARGKYLTEKMFRFSEFDLKFKLSRDAVSGVLQLFIMDEQEEDKQITNSTMDISNLYRLFNNQKLVENIRITEDDVILEYYEFELRYSNENEFKIEWAKSEDFKSTLKLSEDIRTCEYGFISKVGYYATGSNSFLFAYPIKESDYEAIQKIKPSPIFTQNFKDRLIENLKLAKEQDTLSVLEPVVYGLLRDIREGLIPEYNR